MIIGLGSDLCNIERIAHSLERFGERFEKRVFTDVERAKAGDPGGSLVGIASLAAIEGAARNQHYAATKGAVLPISRAAVSTNTT